MQIKGEKFIYLLMGYNLAKAYKGYVKVGHDNDMVGGYNFERRFRVVEFEGKEILTEYKSSKSCADFTRCFEVK